MVMSVKLDQELQNKLQHLANIRKRSAHWIMCEAIRSYVEHEEARESFKQEALDSWTTYQETGRHLSGEEVYGWLQTWGDDQKSAAPKCHE